MKATTSREANEAASLASNDFRMKAFVARRGGDSHRPAHKRNLSTAHPQRARHDTPPPRNSGVIRCRAALYNRTRISPVTLQHSVDRSPFRVLYGT
jgi:hypothetical protein